MRLVIKFQSLLNAKKIKFKNIAIDADGFLCQTRDENQWHGCRCTKGVINKGKYYYEATVTDEGLCRIGWSTIDAVLDLGTDKLGYGFGGTGKKSNNRQFDNYGEVFYLIFIHIDKGILIDIIFKSYGKNDTIGCYLDLDTRQIKWFKNGNFQNTIIA